MRSLSVNEIKNLERIADNSGFTYSEMMQTAGKGIANYIDKHLRHGANLTIVALVGKGNNGGDTLIAVKNLHQAGWSTGVMLAGERNPGDALLKDYISIGGSIIALEDLSRINHESGGKGIILDGVYGTGFHPPLADNIVEIFSEVRASLPGYFWIAVDCPSGIDCETGETSTGTQSARFTVCLEAVKTGLLREKAFPFCGEFVVVDLGLRKYDPSNGQNDDIVLDDSFCAGVLPVRSQFSHKGTFGKTIIVGGSSNYPGAPVLAGRAALAVGTGLVQVAVPESIGQISPVGNPELTWLLLEDAGGIISELAVDTLSVNVASAQSLVLGPGMGRESTTERFLSSLLLDAGNARKSGAGFPGITSRKVTNNKTNVLPALVLDADGLYHISKIRDWQDKCNAKLVLTPHPGEMALLTGLQVGEIQSNRNQVAKEYARQWNQVVVLKGALTVVAAPDGRVAIVPVATASLAKAGTGDVLAGMIGGLLAQGLEPWHAAAAGAYLHARAGLIAEEIIGCSESVLVSDVIRAVPLVIKKVKTNNLP